LFNDHEAELKVKEVVARCSSDRCFWSDSCIPRDKSLIFYVKASDSNNSIEISGDVEAIKVAEGCSIIVGG